MHVTDLMDLPDTGGLDDEIGGHVGQPDDRPLDECSNCGGQLEESDRDVSRDGWTFLACRDDDCWIQGSEVPEGGR